MDALKLSRVLIITLQFTTLRPAFLLNCIGAPYLFGLSENPPVPVETELLCTQPLPMSQTGPTRRGAAWLLPSGFRVENFVLADIKPMVPLLSSTLHTKRFHLVSSFRPRCCIFSLKCLQRGTLQVSGVKHMRECSSRSCHMRLQFAQPPGTRTLQVEKWRTSSSMPLQAGNLQTAARLPLSAWSRGPIVLHPSRHMWIRASIASYSCR